MYNQSILFPSERQQGNLFPFKIPSYVELKISQSASPLHIIYVASNIPVRQRKAPLHMATHFHEDYRNSSGTKIIFWDGGI